MNKLTHYIVKRPILSEESTLQTDLNKYTFRVAPKANKREIREAIESVWDVKVVAVNTMNYRGKQSGRRGRGRAGFRANWKKAIVTLRQGDSIDLV